MSRLGVMAFKHGYAAWTETPSDDLGLASFAVGALRELRDAARLLR